MVSGLVLRDAELDDLPVIVALLADDHLGQSRENVSVPLDPAYIVAFTALEGDPNQRLVVAEIAGAVVGTMQLSFLPGLSRKGAWRCLIEAVRIEAARRGKGLGAEMIGWAAEQSRARGCHRLQLTTDKSRVDAHRFYEKLGFKQSHFGYKLEL